MEFDRSRVYSAVNADELHEGDKVICANCMTDLKKFVQKETETEKLVCVLSENDNDRFYIGDNVSYNLAYLVERKENCTNCSHQEDCIGGVFKGWHNYRYFVQCYYNLEEKYDCGGITDEEWNKIQEVADDMIKKEFYL